MIAAHSREWRQLLAKGVKRGARSKYGATPTVVDGIRFASKRESQRYVELKLLERAGLIRSLALQPVFVCVVSNLGADHVAIGKYVADFSYIESNTGEVIVQDVKGFDTPLSKWKRKHVRAQYGIEVQIVK